MEENKEVEVVSDVNELDVKRENKAAWLGHILVKQVQGLKLSDEEWSFYMNMFVNAKDDEIEKLAKGSVVELARIAEDAKGEIPIDVYWGLKQRDAHLVQNLLKTLKKGRKDDSATRKNDLATFNRLVKDAKKKGGFYGESVVKVVDSPDVIDNTKENKK